VSCRLPFSDDPADAPVVAVKPRSRKTGRQSGVRHGQFQETGLSRHDRRHRGNVGKGRSPGGFSQDCVSLLPLTMTVAQRIRTCYFAALGLRTRSALALFTRVSADAHVRGRIWKHPSTRAYERKDGMNYG
jgi:hypothetical protein